MSDRLQEKWRGIAARLGLHVDTPFTVFVDADEVLVPVRLRQFGGERGMLLVTDYEVLKPHARALVNLGFGFSCLSEPSDVETPDDAGIMEVLQEWGWSDAGEPPEWLATTIQRYDESRDKQGEV